MPVILDAIILLSCWSAVSLAAAALWVAIFWKRPARDLGPLKGALHAQVARGGRGSLIAAAKLEGIRLAEMAGEL